MKGILLRKKIGMIIAVSMWPLIGLGCLLQKIPFLNDYIWILAVVACASGPIGLLIMGPSVDGKPGLVTRILRITGSMAKWGWFLIPVFPIDIFVGLMCLMLGLYVTVFVGVMGAMFFAFIPALIDYFRTKRALAE